MVPLLVVIAVLTFSNVMANRVLPDWAYVPWNLSIAAIVVAIAVKTDGQRARTMGLARKALPAGLRVGAVFSLGLIAIYAVGLTIPWTRPLFLDERADIPFIDMFYKVAIEVPFGTVLLEEVSFRGVLPAMFASRIRQGPRSRVTADACAAGLFGLWHILPSWNVNDVNPLFRDILPDAVGQAAGIVGGVLLTAIAGMGLSWMRNRSDSVLAPAMLHSTSNGVGSALAWVALKVF